MWSLKLTTEQRYKYFEPILPDIKADIKLFWELPKSSWALQVYFYERENLITFKSFMIERTLDNQYQITFYE